MVIAIIAILVALLLPAVQAARAAARRLQCTNHLKQIGIAMHNYHETHGVFPMGTLKHQSGNPVPPGVVTSPPERGWAWSVHILPFLEQSEIYDGACDTRQDD